MMNQVQPGTLYTHKDYTDIFIFFTLSNNNNDDDDDNVFCGDDDDDDNRKGLTGMKIKIIYR